MRAVGRVSAWLGFAATAPVVVLLACGGDAAERAPRLATPPASSAAGIGSSAASATSRALPVATAVAPVATGDATPALHWLKALTPRAVTAKVEELVWATVPTEAGVRLGVYRVLAVSGTSASLLDIVRVRYDHVPGALIQPVALDAPFKVKLDEIVTYADWRGFVGLGVVVRASPTLRITFRDASGVVREEIANVAAPLPAGLAPLAWVMFPKRAASSALHKGIVFAVEGDSVFVRDDALQVFVLDRSRVKLLAVPTHRLKKGDAVLGYTPTLGYQPGVVERELLAHLSYRVTVDGESRTYFFSDLALPDDTRARAPEPPAPTSR